MKNTFYLINFGLFALAVNVFGYSTHIEKIIRAAEADSIDLFALPFVDAAFAQIDEIYTTTNFSIIGDFTSATKIDVHVHAIPDWFRNAVASSPTGEIDPEWDIQSALQFMVNNSIARQILSQPIVPAFPGNSTLSVGIARLINEYLAALAKVHPERFSYYAFIPLAYGDAAIKEAAYNLDTLGALGSCLTTNNEGLYLGNPLFKPFFAYLQSRNSSREVIFIHPVAPYLRGSSDKILISANPTVYNPSITEFFFETARTLQDLTVSQTILNFTKLHWSIPHVGGAFPSILDRFLGNTTIAGPSELVYRNRFWYDSAGSTYPHQVKGLLAYDVPTSQLVYGSDFPWGSLHYPYAMAIENIIESTFLSETEKDGIFFENVNNMFEGTCTCGH